MIIARTFTAVALASVLLVGCATQPSTTPTTAPSTSEAPTPAAEKPAVADLVVTPEGIGDVAIGEAPKVDNPETDLLVFIEGYCQAAIDELVDGGTTDVMFSPDKWVANFEPALSGEGGSDEPFAVAVPEGEITLIVIGDSALRTAEGIGLGSSRAELLAAYPDAQPAEGGIPNASELYTVEGDNGRIELEIALTNDVVGLEDAPLDTVWSFRVTTKEFEPSSWAGIDAGSAVRCISA